jgi:hypothetical protein
MASTFLGIMNQHCRRGSRFSRQASFSSHTGRPRSLGRPFQGFCNGPVNEVATESDHSASAGDWKPPRSELASCPQAWLSLQQTCKELEVSRWTINRLVGSGELKPGVHIRYWMVRPGQKRPKRQYHLGEIEKLLSRISMRHHRLRLRKPAT